MPRRWLAAPFVLCACAGSIVRAPKAIPADGVVEIRELDIELHAVVFSRDVAIARCLAKRE